MKRTKSIQKLRLVAIALVVAVSGVTQSEAKSSSSQTAADQARARVEAAHQVTIPSGDFADMCNQFDVATAETVYSAAAGIASKAGRRGVTADDLNQALSQGELFSTPSSEPGSAGKSSTASTSVLSQLITRDYTEEVQTGAIPHPYPGREKLVTNIRRYLQRKDRKTPVLVCTDPTTTDITIEAVAADMAHSSDAALRRKRVVRVDTEQLIDNPALLSSLTSEVEGDENVCLFIPDFDQLVAAARDDKTCASGTCNNGPSAETKAGILRLLAKARIIGHMPSDKGTALGGGDRDDRKLREVIDHLPLTEPTIEETQAWIRRVKPKLEAHHGLKVSDDVSDQFVRLTQRYIPNRHDEQLLTTVWYALDDALAARSKARQEGQRDDTQEFTFDDLASALKEMTGQDIMIPGSEAERQRLLNFEDELTKRVVGHDHVKGAISQRVRRAKVGLKAKNKPIFSGLFFGPSGVGKTEMAKGLGEALGISESDIIRIDGSEYQEQHAVARLIGAPPGYVGYDEGGELTNKIKANPHSVVLFDEIEKMHPDAMLALLQILDEGKLTDGQGRTADFSNAIIIGTGNIGSDLYPDVYPDQESDRQRIRDQVLAKVKQKLRPELFGRVDSVSVFDQLSPTQMLGITKKRLAQTQKLIHESATPYELDVQVDAVFELSRRGHNPKYGARPLDGLVQTEIEEPLSTLMIEGKIPRGAKVRVSRAAGGQGFKFEVAGNKSHK